jgi:prolyl oligopeptidase
VVPFCGQAAGRKPPETRRDDVREVMHGIELVDPYHWLEDADSTETRAWIAAQNDYTRSFLDAIPVRERIRRRLREMLIHDSIGAPIQRQGVYFFLKRGAEQDLWSVYRRAGIGGEDELLIDPRPMSSDRTVSIGTIAPSEDAGLLAYGIRHGGEDETEVRVFDVKERRDLPDRLPRGLYQNLSWKKDAGGFYYSLARRGVGRRIYFHALGDDSASDQEVFGAGYGPENGIFPHASEDGNYLLAMVWWGWLKVELHLQDLGEKNDGSFRPLITGIDAKFYPQFAGDYLIVQTDWNAPNGRILRIDLREPARENWREIVPEAADAIVSFALIGDKVFVNYLHNVTARIAIFSLDGEPLGKLPLPGDGTAGIYGRYRREEGIVYFGSYTTPYSIYRYNSATGKSDLWYRDAVPFDSENFTTRQVWYSSKDGTRVPMFIVHRKGLALDGNRPTVLYGYGGFSFSLTPNFNHGAAWWIEQGGVYAVPNLRGGGEFGEAWHRAGMLEKKQNVFDDFIAAADWLVTNNYTNPDKLAISGGSNGGLLVGAMMTQRPDLMRAVYCWHPDLDMLRFHNYTKNNNPPALFEYGNPADPDQFKFIHAYSPYEQVKPGTKYPAMLLTSGDADTRVPPAQARKMTARMQAATASGFPILLHYDTHAGHAGFKPTSTVIEDLSIEWSFLAWQLGIE